MSARNEFVIVIMLEPVSLGREFIDWPLHITIVPWFDGNDAKKLDGILSEATKTFPSFSVEVSKIEKFGPKKNIKVNLIKSSPELNELHWSILNVLEKNNFGIHQKEYIGNGYKAHVTHQSHGQKREGENLRINSFTLVKQVRQKKTGSIVKSAVKNYKLKSNE